MAQIAQVAEVEKAETGSLISSRLIKVVTGTLLFLFLLFLVVLRFNHGYGFILAKHGFVKIRQGYLSIYTRRALCSTAAFIKNDNASIVGGRYRCQVNQARAEYAAVGHTYKNNLEDYTPFGDWLYFSRTEKWEPFDEIHFDSENLPLANYRGVFTHNPVTIALYGLSMHGRFLGGDLNARKQFLRVADRLIEMQDARGAFRYPFAWYYYLTDRDYQPGWCSSLAQGLGLSIFARAYQLTGDQKYLAAGDQAFSFLLVPISSGGVMDTMANLDPALSKDIIFEEYPAIPSGHTLNGFMYTMIGIYDWSHVPTGRASEASHYFVLCMQTLRSILPYYDIGGFTTYDLGYLIYHKAPRIGVNYHAVHIYLLHALVSITSDAQLQRYEKLWASYVPQ